MRMLKGFVTIQSLINNTPGQISPLGELSTWSMTYTKERGEYINSAIPGFRLCSVRSVDDVLGNVQVDPTLANQVLEVARAMHMYTVSHLRPYDRDDVKAVLMADFFNRIYNVQFGPFVDNGSLALPQWMTWDSLEHPNNSVKIWLSDTAFADQFDEYQITVIPALSNVDDFFLPPGTVKTLIEARTITRMMEQVQEAKGENPETYVRTLTFDYKPNISGVSPVPSHWSVLIYGIQGDNVDAIKDALVDYILAHSTHTRQEWEALMPDIFKRTEFVVLPRWDKHSVPNLEVQSGLYGSYSDPVEVVTYCANKIDFYPPAWVQNNITIMPFTYKGITLHVVNGFNNVVEKASFTPLFPDYIPVATTSLDFNRMQIVTGDWIMLMIELVKNAETADMFSSVPKHMRKIKRGNTLYITALFDNVNYLVRAKSNDPIV